MPRTVARRHLANRGALLGRSLLRVRDEQRGGQIACGAILYIEKGAGMGPRWLCRLHYWVRLSPQDGRCAHGGTRGRRRCTICNQLSTI